MGQRQRTVLAIGAAFAVGLGLAACSSDSDNTAGGPIPQQRAGETYPGTRSDATVDASLTDNGCWFLTLGGSRRLAVWPAGSAQDPEDGAVVVLPGDVRVVDGTQLDVSAVVVPVTSLAGYPDGYWGSQLTFCDPSGTEVLVLDSATLPA